MNLNSMPRSIRIAAVVSILLGAVSAVAVLADYWIGRERGIVDRHGKTLTDSATTSVSAPSSFSPATDSVGGLHGPREKTEEPVGEVAQVPAGGGEASAGDRDARTLGTPQSAHIPTALHLEDDRDPLSVVGREFPLSPSIRRLCQARTPDEVKACGIFWVFLEKMKMEPRNPNWANDTERRILRLLELETADIDIRSVECRSASCAVEVASTQGYLGLDGERDPVLRCTHFVGMTEHATERNELDQGLKVTVMTLDRRPNLRPSCVQSKLNRSR